MNEVIETVLRQYVDWNQSNWLTWLPVVASSICGRDSASTGTNAFFMTHGWNQSLFDQIQDDGRNSPIAKADRIIKKLKEVSDWAQASMAVAQELQERNSNKKRDQAPNYQVGDKIVGSHSFRLDTPPGIHNVFHSRLLRPANSSPLPGQIVDDNQPPSIKVNGSEEYEIDEILDQKKAPGKGKHMKYLVKWVGYAKPTWEPESFLIDTSALASWKSLSRTEKMKNMKQKKERNN